MSTIRTLCSAARRPSASGSGAWYQARNRALVDGDKRLARGATAVFLGINGHRAATGNNEVVELVLAVAAEELDDVAAIATRLRGWTPR